MSLQENEARFKLLAENAEDYIFIKDKARRYTFVNQAMARLFGVCKDDLLGRTPEQVFGPEQYKVVQEVDERSFSGEVVDQTESLVINGTKKFFHTIQRPLHFENGQVVSIMGIVRDITSHIQAQEDLKRARNYISNIIDLMPSVVIGFDVSGEITLWNKKAEKQTGLASEAAVGQLINKAFPRLKDQTERLHQLLLEQNGQPFCKRLSYVQNGRTYFEDMTAFPIHSDDQFDVVIRLDDVTEQVRLQELMVHNEKMLSIGGLAAGMAHELNNPLAGILQSIFVIRERLTNDGLAGNRQAAAAAGTSMEAIKLFLEKSNSIEMLDQMHLAGVRAAQIIQNMLSFARKTEASFSKEEIPDLIDQAVELAGSDYDMQNNFDFRRIQIIREYQKDLPAVSCQAGKIQQVLLNVLRNGAEAMQANSGDRAQCFILRVFKHAGEELVTIEIEDNGPGIDENTRRHIFEPFFSTKVAQGGTGLGLSVSYYIVTENHAGQMSVKSTPGQGATFIIKLPVDNQ